MCWIKKTITFVLLTGVLTLFSIQICDAVPDLYIDPGHGGDDPGCPTPIPDYYEKDVNLSVALEVKEWFDGYPGFFEVMYSRLIDTTIPRTHRAYQANGAGCSTFVSIHHNSDDPCPETQYTVSLYSSWDTCVGGDHNPWQGTPRNTTSLLAQKLGYKIRDAFHYNLKGPWDTQTQYTVLCRTFMASTITEASFICQTDEAYKFYLNQDDHIGKEAYAIFEGWLSYAFGQGIAMVDYGYCAQGLPEAHDVEISDPWGEMYIYDAPYVGCWGEGEIKVLHAIDFTECGYDYVFHHWEFRNWTTGEIYQTWWDRYYQFTVQSAPDSTHYYEAYFTGGPFWVSLLYPNAQVTEILQNDTVTILWDAPQGVRQTCSLYVDLSTNGGGSWSPIAGPLPYNNDGAKNTGTYDWIVPVVSSDNCHLRLIAYDVAGNYDTLVSHCFSIDYFMPEAAFTANPDSGNAPLPVAFYDESTGQPFYWHWDFGDETTSEDQNPVHIYYNPDYYTVTLTVTNMNGSDTVVVNDAVKVENCCFTRGDVNHGGEPSSPDITDLVYLVNYMFNSGPEPPCKAGGNYFPEADINGDLFGPDITDMIYLMNYMFNSGPPSVPCP